MKKISLVIPVYRNEGELETTYQVLKKLFGGPLQSYQPEFVFVDDGSDDRSLNELLSLHQQNSSVIVISLSRNFGQTSAIIAGFRHATGDAIIALSADGQEPTELVTQFVTAWENGAQVIIGKRTSREDSLSATILGNIYWRILKWSNPNLPTGSDVFLLDRSTANIFNQLDESDRFYPIDVLWLGFDPVIVPYQRLKRTIGRSQWSVARKVKAGLDGILHNTYLPIRMISTVGMIVAIMGFMATLLVIFNKLSAKTVYPGWASIICLLLFLNGLIMFMLGIIAEYIWRIYNQAKGRPVYLIKKKYG